MSGLGLPDTDRARLRSATNQPTGALLSVAAAHGGQVYDGSAGTDRRADGRRRSRWEERSGLEHNKSAKTVLMVSARASVPSSAAVSHSGSEGSSSASSIRSSTAGPSSAGSRPTENRWLVPRLQSVRRRYSGTDGRADVCDQTELLVELGGGGSLAKGLALCGTVGR